MPPTFLVRGQDVSDILYDPLLAPDSLFSIIFDSSPGLKIALQDHWNQKRDEADPMGGTPFRPAIGAFSALEGWWKSGYGDGALAEAIFAGERADDAAVVTGCADAATFAKTFEAARDEAFYIFLQPTSVSELNGFSFKATYLHRDIEDLFKQRPQSYVATVLRYRVLETARIMFRILWGNMNGAWRTIYDKRSMITTLLLAVMHNQKLSAYKRQGRQLYNQSSVAFTLLTFSYVPAMAWRAEKARRPKGFDFDEARWYYFWRIFGSLLGLSARIIPHDHDEAEAMWERFFSSGECVGDPEDLTYQQPGFDSLDTDLVNAFDTANGVRPDAWTLADMLSFLPAWLVTQLRSSGRWFNFLKGS